MSDGPADSICSILLHVGKAQHAGSACHLVLEALFHCSAGQLVRQAVTGHGKRGLLATSPQPYTVNGVYSPVLKVVTALPYGHYGGGGLKAGYSAGGAASCMLTALSASAVHPA